MIPRCHAVLGRGDLALHHADRCTRVVDEAGLQDFDRAYAHEARARALACCGDAAAAAAARQTAEDTAIEDAEDRRIFEADLTSAPWFGLDPTEPDPRLTG